MQKIINSKSGVNLLLLLMIIVLFFTYSNHFGNSFHFDDSHTIVSNLAIRDIKNIPLFFKDGTTFSSLPSNQSYRPVVTTLNALDYFFAGKALPEPLAFHCSIFIYYVLTGLLFYYVLQRVLRLSGYTTYAKGIALFTTAWFWLHTANAETINYIIARSDSFSTFMVVLAFAIYLRFPALQKFHLYLIPIIIGFLTKEPAILFIPLLFLYKLFFEADLSFSTALKNFKKTGMVMRQMLVPIGICLLLFMFYRHMTPKTWTPGGVDRSLYIATQPYVIFHYFANFLLPIHLVVDTDWTSAIDYADSRIYKGIFFLLLMVVSIVITSFKRENRLIAFGLIWFLLGLAPTSLIPFAEIMNDHRTFFPYLGLFIAAATLLAKFFARFSVTVAQSPFFRIVAALLMVLFLGFHAYGTYERNKIWHTEMSLWKEATQKAPNNGRAWMNYGLSQMAIGNYDSARVCFQKTMVLWPNYPIVLVNMGILEMATGHVMPAEKYFQQALQMDRSNPETYAFYADFLLKNNRTEEAKSIIAEGLKLSPNHEMLRNLLHTQPAPVQPATMTDAEAYLQVSLNLYNQGQFEACIKAAEQALKLKPDYDLAYNNICAAYNQLKEWDKAITAGEKGIRINPANEWLKGNLAVAYKRGK